MKLQNITASYKDKKIYEDISVDFNQVGITFIKGDSGCGKTTLLNILYGLKSFKGDIIVDGNLDDFRRDNMAYIFQDFKVDPYLTVYENIILQLNIKDIKIDENHIDELLKEFDMYDNKHKLTKVLSGGEKQRLAITRALVTNPSILLCDEPTGNLDEDTSLEIFDLLKKISKEKIVIVVSHNEMLINTYSDVVYQIIDMDLVTTKNNDFKQACFSDDNYGKISFRNIFKISKVKFTRSLIRKVSIFLVFSLMCSLFLMLNFSKNDNVDYLIEKYGEYSSKDTIYVEYTNLKSINYLEEFKKEFEFDGYLLDNASSYDKPTYSTFFKRNQLLMVTRLSITPDFMTDDEIKAIREATFKQAIDRHYRKPDVPLFTPYDYPAFGLAVAVSNMQNLEEFIVYGRLPKNNFEFLINENYLESLIDEYNLLLEENPSEFEPLNYLEMNEEEIFQFFENNNVLRRSNFLYNLEYDLEKIHDVEFKIVGIVNDYPYVYDKSTATSLLRYLDYHGEDIMYVSTNSFLISSKLESTYLIRGYYDRSKRFNTLDPKIIIDDRSVNFKSVKLFKVGIMYKKDLDIMEYASLIEDLEEHDDVKEIRVTEMYRHYLHDIAKFNRINNQINTFSIYILLVAFLTAFVPFYHMNRKRQGEFFMYYILGMNKNERLSVYMLELLFTISIVAILTTGSYFGFMYMFNESLMNVFNSLIYENTLSVLQMKFNIIPVLVIAVMFIPFILTFITVDYRTKENSND